METLPKDANDDKIQQQSGVSCQSSDMAPGEDSGGCERTVSPEKVENHNQQRRSMGEDESDPTANSTIDSTMNSTMSSTMGSECNVTVIHLTSRYSSGSDPISSPPSRQESIEKTRKPNDDSMNSSQMMLGVPEDEGTTLCRREDQCEIGFDVSGAHQVNEAKSDSKDGSDSGVEGCAVEMPRVASRNSMDYASSCNGLDEASCGDDSSLASCCSVYEDPCGSSLAEDVLRAVASNDGSIHHHQHSGAEGTSEAGSESSSLAGSISAMQNLGSRSTSASRRLNTGSISSTAASTHTNRRRLPPAHTTDHQHKAGSIQHPRPGVVNGTTATGARAKPRTSSANQQQHQRTSSLVRCRQSVSRDRCRSRDKSRSKDSTGGSTTTGLGREGCTSTATASTVASRCKARPDTLPSALTTEINRDLAQRGGRPNSAVASSRPRGGGAAPRMSMTATGRSTITGPSTTPNSDESRRSLSSVGRSSSLTSSTTSSVRFEHKNVRLFDKMTQSLDSSKALDTYGTLPRSSARRKQQQQQQQQQQTGVGGSSSQLSRANSDSCGVGRPPVAHRSRSGSRDASLSRLLGRRAIAGVAGSKDAAKLPLLPPFPRSRPAASLERTRIYHEISVQTGLTGKDIDNCLAGVATILPNPESAEKIDGDTQTEGSWEDLQQMKKDLKMVTGENDARKKENQKLTAELDELKKKFAEEQSDHAFARQELDRNAQRVLAMLGTPQSEHADGGDSFLELESHIQSSGKVVANQQIEIADLQSLCRMLSRDLEKSLAAQKTLLQQQQELEAESMEIQDFLQEEKAALEIGLKEAESELKKRDENIKNLTAELERQNEACTHLVRISEQRRQENLSLSMKLNAAERRSKELLLAQGAAVSGASVALSGLGNRLAGLIDQLIISYNISEKDLEDVIYHNEAFSRSNSSVESSPVSSKHSLKDCTPSPKRGSFVSAVIGAIKNAATHPFATKQVNEKKSEPSKAVRKDVSVESSSEILDFETEPCLMMENVLEDVSLPDTYTHNMISSCDSLRRVMSVPENANEHNLRKTRLNGESSSLTNLTQAILHRRKVEDEEEENCESMAESEHGPSDHPLPASEYPSVTSLVDQVIDVDNFVTKLLKVLRIIQLDNDTCIQELRDEKVELETRLEIFLAERKSDKSWKVSDIKKISMNDDFIGNCKNESEEMRNSNGIYVNGQTDIKNGQEDSIDEECHTTATIILPSSVCS
ncbi:hypothetical protein QAD02_017005 [Eretmocerus hayati]|uniref:Uncharacterized protein n=1 Tax=Eretmocerus hayati TaxID=131215 RepID=A0ACC2PCP3_9HYME|nr:hypothetical protein QAD02_017005 [Eretmocerus hayati]